MARTRPRRSTPTRRIDGFLAFALDQLSGLGDITPRRMFGGVGLYCGELFFALIAGDTLYLKVDDESRPEFVRIGSKPFKPYPDKPMTMNYYHVSAALLEDAGRLERYGRLALAAADRGRQAPTRRAGAKSPTARPKKRA